MKRGARNISCANDIQMDGRMPNYLALWLAIVVKMHPGEALDKMGVFPHPSNYGKAGKNKYNHLAKVCYIMRHVCGVSSAEIGELFKISGTYVFQIINKGRSELIDGVSKNIDDSR